MGLQVEQDGENEFDFTDDFVQGGGDGGGDSSKKYHHGQRRHHLLPPEAAASFRPSTEDWEEISRDPADHCPATPPRSHVHSKGISGSRQAHVLSSSVATSGATTYTQHQQLSRAGPPSPRPAPQAPVLDLYDQLMTKELNEATSTPLVDFGVDDDGPSDSADITRWRRHAREPAINNSNNINNANQSNSQPSRTRHERHPAASLI